MTLAPSSLIEAVERGDCPAVRRALGAGADANGRDPHSKLTLLMIAAARGHADMVEVLINADADVHAVEPAAGASVLHKACQGGSKKVVELLLGKKAFVDAVAPTTGHTPLMDALWYKWPDVAELLLKHGANLKVSTHYGFSLLEHFEYELRVNTVGKERLLKAEEHLRRRQREDELAVQSQLLMSAVSRGAVTTVRHLLAQGADVDPIFPVVGGFNDGHTPLLVACRDGHYEIAKMLLAAKADVNRTDPVFGAVPLHKAVYNGRADITKLLVQQPGIKLNAQGSTNGYTPLHDALWHGFVDCAEILIDAGAALDIVGHDGKTPLDIARDSFGPALEIVTKLQKRGK